MEDIELKIKELEKQLELKRAYLDASVSFSKGSKFSQEVKDEVIRVVKETCAKAAEGKPTAEPVSQIASPFTEQEVAILKEMTAKLLARANKAVPAPNAPAESRMSSLVSQGLRNIQAQNMAQILMLDGIDRTLRDKVESGAIVRVIGKKDAATVLVEDVTGLRFHMPLDDLDFNYQKETSNG